MTPDLRLIRYFVTVAGRGQRDPCGRAAAHLPAVAERGHPTAGAPARRRASRPGRTSHRHHPRRRAAARARTATARPGRRCRRGDPCSPRRRRRPAEPRGIAHGALRDRPAFACRLHDAGAGGDALHSRGHHGCAVARPGTRSARSRDHLLRTGPTSGHRTPPVASRGGDRAPPKPAPHGRQVPADAAGPAGRNDPDCGYGGLKVLQQSHPVDIPEGWRNSAPAR